MIWPECFTFFAVNLVPESHMASWLADCRSSEDLIDADKLNSGALNQLLNFLTPF